MEETQKVADSHCSVLCGTHLAGPFAPGNWNILTWFLHQWQMVSGRESVWRHLATVVGDDGTDEKEQFRKMKGQCGLLVQRFPNASLQTGTTIQVATFLFFTVIKTWPSEGPSMKLSTCFSCRCVGMSPILYAFSRHYFPLCLHLLFRFIYLVFMHVLLASMYVCTCTVYVPGIPTGQKRMSDPLELEIVRHGCSLWALGTEAFWSQCF